MHGLVTTFRWYVGANKYSPKKINACLSEITPVFLDVFCFLFMSLKNIGMHCYTPQFTYSPGHLSQFCKGREIFCPCSEEHWTAQRVKIIAEPQLFNSLFGLFERVLYGFLQ